MGKVLIGLDPGFANSGMVVGAPMPHGFEVFEYMHHDTDNTAQKKQKLYVAEADMQRVIEMVEAVDKFIEKCRRDYRVGGLIVELPSAGAKSSRAGRALALSTGWLGAFVKLKNMPVEYIRPSEVKQIVTGTNKATKEQVMAYVRTNYPGIKWPDTIGAFEHVADAVVTIEAARNTNLYKLAMED
jgi:Holliday junction resolvasome RuvABC endonuclease subunit